jgi:hypothetical protein
MPSAMAQEWMRHIAENPLEEGWYKLDRLKAAPEVAQYFQELVGEGLLEEKVTEAGGETTAGVVVFKLTARGRAWLKSKPKRSIGVAFIDQVSTEPPTLCQKGHPMTRQESGSWLCAICPEERLPKLW